MFASKSLLLGLLGSAKLGYAVRATVNDLEAEGTGSDFDHLKVVYKHCFAKALKDKLGGKDDGYPLIPKDGVDFDDDEAWNDKGNMYSTNKHWYLLRMNDFSCSMKMTSDKSKQRDISFSEIKDAFNSDNAEEAEKVYNAYPERPEKTWWELGLDAEDQQQLDAALKALYVSQMRNKHGNFYILDRIIAGECLDTEYEDAGPSLVMESDYLRSYFQSGGKSAKTERCHKVLANGGKLKFSAAERFSDGSYTHLSGTPDGFVGQDATLIMDASEGFGAAFQKSCVNSFHEADSKFDEISPRFCSGDNYYKCGEGTPSIETCSNSIVANVLWDGSGNFQWKD